MKVTINTPNHQLSMSFVAHATGGYLITADMTDDAVSFVCTDSREADANTLFCAIRGERVDGHNYMASAAKLGCVAFLCEKVPQDMMSPYIAVVVEDTVVALSKLAEAYRDTYLKRLTPVAVTGSVGKTTTKECVSAVLGEWGNVFKKEGNYNSVIGLPLSVLEISPDCERAVLEMGMSGFSEISAMSCAVSPHIAMITNIGHAHMELLGSRENIAKAKLEISNGMGRGDILLINGDEPLLVNARSDISSRGIEVLSVSMTNPQAEVYVSHIRHQAESMMFDITYQGETWQDMVMPAVGIHMVWAAAFAVSVGRCMGMNQMDIQKGLFTYTPAAMRQRVLTWQGMTLIEDCYNASPESMRAACSVLAMTAKSRMIAVLGDMKELGDESASLHVKVGQNLMEITSGKELYLVTVGELGAKIAEGAIGAGLTQNHVYISNADAPYSDVCEHLHTLMQTGDTLLFKASRAMQLESIIAQIKNSSND